ncbi:hypothetical protein V6N11_054786 [Hibiscus sabdariffa]|uniref:Secreted protein n=1 Tax=Hibiscus sabdariffa TaxID=183260 RepID=A0ABR2S549_9ROSI
MLWVCCWQACTALVITVSSDGVVPPLPLGSRGLSRGRGVVGLEAAWDMCLFELALMFHCSFRWISWCGWLGGGGGWLLRRWWGGEEGGGGWKLETKEVD